MTLNEAFKHAVDESPVSQLEISWSLKITVDRLNELLNGANYNEIEELHMHRFVFKAKQKSGVTPPLGSLVSEKNPTFLI